ncbi:MAG: histidine phosphatase family protein [Parcubacteria group bacterium]|nr:histidine phosphatase family protein [Parcubacteria group bacterium]
MHLYFIRHGESVYNAKDTVQPPEAELSKLGIKQAQALAERASRLPIEAILSSPFVRTRQTAEIIKEATGKEVIYTELLQERRSPSDIVGLKRKDPRIISIRRELRIHASNPAWHYSDEENFSELRDRAAQFLEFVSSRNEERILAVTHGDLLRMVLMVMMLGNEVAPDIFYRFNDFFKTRNTGITLCIRHSEKGWQLLTWNDHAHLG